jgi:transmembrane sensor
MDINELDTMKQPLHINDDLLISYLLKEVSEEQALQVEEWRAMDTANERRFEQFRLIWDSSKNFTADPDIDALASLQSVKQRAAEQKPQAKVVSLHRYGWLKIAAVLLFIAGGSWLFVSKFMNAQVAFETQDMVKTDTLSDGSMITLNKYALLNYPKRFRGGFFQCCPQQSQALYYFNRRGYHKSSGYIVQRQKPQRYG